MTLPTQQTERQKCGFPGDPLAEVGLNGFARRFRCGEMSSEQVTRAYLARIASLDRIIDAYSVVDEVTAIRTSREMDKSRDRGVDLGPLMGVPVAVKEIFKVEGLPFSASTAMDLSDMELAEGPLIRSLKDQGAVILGLTRTTEFAAATINVSRPVAWNPWDAAAKRVCGGSSHGSAASLAAGLCGFAVGSDSGGSVRLPAALCGAVGLMPSKGWCSTDGIFPLAPTFDTVGFFTRSVDDAWYSLAALSGRSVDDWRPSKPIRFARPIPFFDGLDVPVELAMEQACAQLSAVGVEITDMELPCFDEALQLHARLLVSELVLHFGRDRLIENRDRLDAITWSRVEPELGATPDLIERLKVRQNKLIGFFQSKIVGFDAVLTPTTPISPGRVSELDKFEKVAAWSRLANRNTRPGNLFDQCGISMPLPFAGSLPVGLQLLLPRGGDVQLLRLARFVQQTLGRGPRPDLDGFVQHQSRNPKQ